MNTTTQEFATRTALIRRAIAAHHSWIEEKLGVQMSETVIIDGLPNLSQVGVQRYLGAFDRRRKGKRESTRLRPLVAQAEVPPHYPPLLSIADDVRTDLSLEALLEDREAAWTGFEWEECPLAVRLHFFDITVVLLNVSYHSGPGSPGETTARVLVARRDSISALLRLFEDLYRRDRTPHLHTVGGKSRRVSAVAWTDLVIDPIITKLLVNDFESFWQREQWFRDRNLPFRRGYLLHGPPGNGKTSAIRAMMTSRSLNAHTLRFFDPSVEDADLDHLARRVRVPRPGRRRGGFLLSEDPLSIVPVHRRRKHPRLPLLPNPKPHPPPTLRVAWRRLIRSGLPIQNATPRRRRPPGRRSSIGSSGTAPNRT